MVAPLELPDLTMLADSHFEIERFQIGGGGGQTAEVQDPLWQYSYRLSGFPNVERRTEWRKFLTRLDGIRPPVLVYDPTRIVPLDYYDASGKPLASGSPWGAPTVADYDRAASTFDLAGWTANQQLYADDYISFQDTNGRWHLHRLIEDVQANGTGAVTVEVRPRPARGLLHGNAALRVRKACCAGILRWQISQLRWGGDKGSPITIDGQEIPKALL